MFYKQRNNLNFGYFQIKNEKIAQYNLSDLAHPQSILIEKIFSYIIRKPAFLRAFMLEG